ncbi:hypothetical protein PHSY_005097 [Pseudozyma hubeiensis SY62]|uniref:Chromosome transmission fidelity protein 8 n=1 Tax=Pseudozyma hubeiensis (strain SY62) TaxID=1305764 RepID=R9P819_PSEHS|nr:hypothetical protein PHSY_005097 [Pseudozyma hubeiensis SY62]GAC97511.1 hypothetical protein PHSY_005097 [Pseudozyma hubeiensis SY62]
MDMDVHPSGLRKSAPTPLTALSPSGELLLIELQGSLEIENSSPTGNQILGTISFDPTRQDRPVLMISHHRLEGKFVNLVKPLAVLEKRVREDKVLSDVANGKRQGGEAVGNVKRAKKEVSGTRGSSPPVETRAKDALDFSSSPPRQTPIKSKMVRHVSGLDGIDENVPGPGNSSEQNGRKSDRTGEDDEDEEEEEAQTAVYYDVVSVIKRKILFSKRPEPIVRLDTSPTAVRIKGASS